MICRIIDSVISRSLTPAVNETVKVLSNRVCVASSSRGNEQARYLPINFTFPVRLDPHVLPVPEGSRQGPKGH